MNALRIPALLAASILLAVSCARQDDDYASPTGANPLLSYVPADTPYVFANLESTPPEVIDAFLARFQPILDEGQVLLDDIRIEVNAENPSEGEAFLSLASALLDEVDGKLNREGLESLGFSLESHKAVYGIGAFPVVRIGLRDAAALRAAINRVKASSGMEMPELELDGTPYWRLTDEDGNGGVYIAILDDHVAFSLFPVAAEDSILPGFLGQAMPGTSMADTGALEQLNRDKGFTHYGSGFMDFTKLAEEFLNPTSRTVSFLQTFTGYDPAGLDPACATEARSIAAAAPRLIAGTTELNADAVGMRYQLEIETTLAGQLAKLVSDVAVASDSPGNMLSASLGVNFGALREFLLDKTTELAASPFQCPQLADLNKQISELAMQLNQPMPPFIGNFKGFRLAMAEMDLPDFQPEKARGMFSLEVESPQMLVGMASMMVPGVEELGIEPGGEPVQLPEELLRVATAEFDVWAVMTSDSIGFSLGKDQQDGLLDFMNTQGGNNGTFFSLDYDMAMAMNFKGKQMNHYSDAEPGYAVESGSNNAMYEALMETYKAMMGRTRMEFKFTRGGLVIDNRMTFR